MSILEAHLPKQRQFVDHVRDLTSQVKPRVIVFFGKHAPFEPMGAVADAIAKKYPKDQVLTVRIPDDHTPLGQALDAEAVAVQLHLALRGGIRVLPGFSSSDHVELAGYLGKVFNVVDEESIELMELSQNGFQAGSGVADDKIRAHLNDRLPVMGDSTRKLLEAMQIMNPVAPEEEMIIQELAPSFPGVHFLSLHGGIVSPNIYSMGLPDKDVLSTRYSGDFNLKIVRDLNAFGRYQPYGWSLSRIGFCYSHLRKLLDMPFVNDKVNFTYFELPQSAKDTSPLAMEVFLRAIKGAFLFPNPFFYDDKDTVKGQVPPKEMDYFRISAENRTEEHIEAITDYLGVMLENIV